MRPVPVARAFAPALLAVLVVVPLAGCSSAPAPKPDKYCLGVMTALPSAPPQTVADAPGQINALTQVVPPGNDKPLHRLVLNLDKAIAQVGRAQGTLGGGASAGQIAGFYSALRAVKAYCQATSVMHLK